MLCRYVYTTALLCSVYCVVLSRAHTNILIRNHPCKVHSTCKIGIRSTNMCKRICNFLISLMRYELYVLHVYVGKVRRTYDVLTLLLHTGIQYLFHGDVSSRLLIFFNFLQRCTAYSIDVNPV